MKRTKSLLVVLIFHYCTVSAHEIDISKFFNELQGQIGYGGTDIHIQGESIEALESKGINKQNDKQNTCNKDSCNVGEIFSTEQLRKRQQKTEETGFNRNNKGFLDKALYAIKHAGKEFDVIKSNSDLQCKSEDEAITDITTESCDQYYMIAEESCFPKQVVEIDPKYHYQCSKKREVKEKTCSDIITSIKCQNNKECDIGGIEPGSVASDMRFHLDKGVLTIGTISDNYWGGNCDLYDKTTSFKLKNIHLIKEFNIFNVGFDDYMEIVVNGASVYAGPDGGSNLKRELKGGGYVINNGHSKKWCERSTNWNFGVNINLIPYLKEGENNIRIRVFVSGNGEGWLKIRAKQNCCSKWNIERGTICDYK